MAFDALVAAAFAASASAGWGLAWLRFRRVRRYHDRLLRRAKGEVQDMAQLSLNNPHPVIEITDSGTILFINPTASKLFQDLKREGRNHVILRDLGAQQTTREVMYDGRVYHQTITKTQSQGEAASIVYCYDITERKHYETELKDAHRRAEKAHEAERQAKEARGDFLANMSHELRTPMNGIIGLSDILMERGLAGDNQTLIEAVNSSAKNLLTLLNDILDFSKIEAGELSLEAVAFDLHHMIGQIKSLQETGAADKGLAFHVQIAGDVPRFVIGDPTRIRQILNNLLSNAIKFTHEGSVTLSAGGGRTGDAEDYTLTLAVIDTGIGIPAHKQAAVFAKFQQADTSTARKYGGTGLGLSITKDLTQLMKGTIAIESEEGRGTTFTVSIPVTIAPAGSVEPIAGSGRPLEKGGLNFAARLLIVDDHPINLLYMREALRSMGLTNFDEAPGGRQAIDCCDAGDYDLILMDCQMPDVDGFTAARHIRKQAAECGKPVPVMIAVTANAMKGAEEQCKAAGMDDYISKPVDKTKLYHLLKHWIPGDDMADTPINHEHNDVIQSAGGEGLPVFDFEFLRATTGGNATLQREILKVFMESLKADIAVLDDALKRHDFDQWNESAHKLYGACAHVGAFALGASCDAAQSLDHYDSETAAALHAAVLHEYDRLKEVLGAPGKPS